MIRSGAHFGHRQCSRWVIRDKNSPRLLRRVRTMGHDASFLLWEEGGDYSDHHRPSFAPQPRTSLRAALPQPIALSRAATNISALSPGSGIGTEFCPAMLLVAASKSLFFACRKAPSPPLHLPVEPWCQTLRASLTWVVCLLMGWGQRTLTFRPDIAASQGCRGGAATRR